MGAVGFLFAWTLLAAAWSVPASSREGKDRFAALVASLSIGLILVMLLAFGLGLFGRFYMPAVCLAALLLAVPALRRKTPCHGWPLLLAPSLLLALTALSPERGRWVSGGWDPGVYLNEGVALSRTGAFVQDDRWFHESFDEQARLLFMRFPANRHERFPGVLSEGNAIDFQFFKLFPSALALLHQAGGLGLASRANVLFGLLSLLAAAALGRQISPRCALVFPLALGLSPVFLYHSHVPVTEMLELFLMLLLGLALWAKVAERLRAGLVAFVFFAAILNRFSFAPMAAILLVLLAVGRRLAGERTEALRMVWAGAAAIALATGVDLWVAPASMLGWSVGPALFKLTGAACVLALAVAGIPLSERLLAWGRGFASRVLPWLVAALCLLALAYGAKVGLVERPEKNQDNLIRLMPFFGAGWGILALAGLCSLPALRAMPGRFHVLPGFLLVLTALLLYDKNIQDLYPWALRRYLPQTLPLLMILAGVAVEQAACLFKGRRAAWALALILPLAAAAPSLRASRDAFRRIEFQNLDARIAEVAAQVGDEAIVVSDDPRWGTPLALLHGRRVVNGKKLWDDKTGEVWRVSLAHLHGARAKGPVYFFTSLENGLAIYPELPPHRLVWEGAPFAMDRIDHHPRAKGFSASPMSRRFRLYELTDAPAP